MVKLYCFPAVDDVTFLARLSRIVFCIQGRLVYILVTADASGPDVPEFPGSLFFMAFGAGSGQMCTRKCEAPGIVHFDRKPAFGKSIGSMTLCTVRCNSLTGELAVVEVFVAIEAQRMLNRLVQSIFMAFAATYPIVLSDEGEGRFGMVKFTANTLHCMK
jgi:hypothetical protein